jgi:hypothetical protein
MCTNDTADVPGRNREQFCGLDTDFRIHRQNVEVKNADGKKRRRPKCRMGQKVNGKNVERTKRRMVNNDERT